MNKSGIVAGMLLVCLASLQCAAGHISLDIDSSSSFSNGHAAVKVKATNKGDEPAWSVWIEGKLGDSSTRSREMESLEVNGAYQATLDLGTAPQPFGEYTVVIKVHYADANGYPFTALRTIPLISAEPDTNAARLKARMSAVRLRKTAWITLRLLLDNTAGNEESDVRATLVLPEELQCPTPVLSLHLQPGIEQTARFKLRNAGALPGSTYPVFAVIDYLRGGRHQSITASANVVIIHPWRISLSRRPIWLILIIPIAVLFVILQFIPIGSRSALRPAQAGAPAARRPSSFSKLFPYAVLAILLAFTLCHIPPAYLFKNTLTVGGDTPAHNYLAGHLREQLFTRGRIVSWAGGWWCGFPMFQYYFCLPYLLMSFISLVLPFNIAFKLVTVLGILALPASSYAAGRLMRLPRPVPLLLAIAMIPLLFDKSHTMWGVNIYSTLAGMISNSISFPIMLLFIACAARDTDDGRFRLGTAFLFAALLASHFFTSVVAGLTVAFLPLLRPRVGAWQAFVALAKELALGCLLMAWWLVPLAAKGEYAVDFGVNWDVRLHANLPPFVFWLLPFACIAVIMAIAHRERFVTATCCMLLVSFFLFHFGHRISNVFVNVRLYPFIIYAVLALSASGIGMLLKHTKADWLAVATLTIVVLVYEPGFRPDIPAWAKWNYEGLEGKMRRKVFDDLVIPLRGTPGRLANDLHQDNESLGSSRIFECVPHLIGKPILEGGIVNSALGSMYSYYIQGETSKSCAGFPTIVKPTGFNFTNATRHLELFNVKHFIARWSRTKDALKQSKDWRLVRESEGWELHELLTHEGHYVFVPENDAIGVLVRSMEEAKKAGLDWIYTIEALNQPFVFLLPGEKPDRHLNTILTWQEYAAYLSALRDPKSQVSNLESRISNPQSQIRSEKVNDNTIRFTTDAIGRAHIIKCAYFPNWKVRGAEKALMVSPSFMLVYPTQNEVELYYGYTFSDNVGRAFSLLGLLLSGLIWRKRKKNHD